jgi:hypothetical protein
MSPAKEEEFVLAQSFRVISQWSLGSVVYGPLCVEAKHHCERLWQRKLFTCGG